MAKRFALLGLLSLAVLAVSCGGSGKTTDLGAITTNDLAVMVLPAAELGSVASGLDVDPDSGFQNAAAVAEDTIDPDDTAGDIEQTGLRSDYQLSYSNIASSKEPVQVSTEVTLFGSAEEASDFVATEIGDAEQYKGTELANGAKITSVDVKELDEPGDTAWRGTATATVGDTDITSTVVAFTIGPVAASVSITRVGNPASTAEVEELAQALATRVEAVAAGEVSETPVPVPAKTTPPSTTTEQDPVLERMVLSLDDLPAGVTIKNDGYVTKQNGDVSFEREFALGNSSIGRSALIGLQSNVGRMDSAAAAALAVGAVSSIVKGPEGAKLFANAFGQGAGFEADSIHIRELPAGGIGDRTTALHATFDTRVGPFEAVFVFIANGRAAGQIYATGAKGKVRPGDILALARTMAKKMEAGR